MESESCDRALALSDAPLPCLDCCSALVSFSTRFRVSLGESSPSSPHFRLDRSGGHIGVGRFFSN